MGHSGSPGGRGQDPPPQPPTKAVQVSRPIDPTSITTANSNHVVTPSLARPPALGSTPPAVQSAPRVGAVVRSWSTARCTDAAQTIGGEASSPSPMDQHTPGTLGKRTTEALVAQGIEHRFPNDIHSCAPSRQHWVNVSFVQHIGYSLHLAPCTQSAFKTPSPMRPNPPLRHSPACKLPPWSSPPFTYPEQPPTSGTVLARNSQKRLRCSKGISSYD
jgi:hypothetical protein